LEEPKSVPYEQGDRKQLDKRIFVLKPFLGKNGTDNKHGKDASGLISDDKGAAWTVYESETEGH